MVESIDKRVVIALTICSILKLQSCGDRKVAV